MHNAKVRQSNLELCRIVAILLVVLLHSNFGWCGWPSSIDDCNILMLFVEAFAIIGVNVFVMITGYFSTNLRTKSIINLFYICLFYAVVKLLYGAATGNVNPKDILFISSSNWFIPSYLGLLLFTPILNAIDRQKYKLGGVLILLFLYEIWFGYFPAMAKIEPGFNHGYSVISFAVIYLLARYIRLYGIAKWFRKNSLIIYVICSILIGIEAYVLLYYFSGRVHNVSNLINFMAYSYCNPLVLLSSVAFFLTFEKMEIRYSKVINYVAQSVLAVLLIHSSSTLNTSMKLYFRNILCNYDGIAVVLLWVLGILGIFIVSILIDSIRIYSYKIVGSWLVAKANLLVNKILKILK